MQEWETSNQSPKNFCENHAIKEHIFYYWRKKYQQSKNVTSEGFVPISIDEPERLVSSMIEIAYPNGTLVRLGNGTSLSMVRSLIGLL